ncbi:MULTISPECIES: HAMP domain-containing sensor histidine kinase [unclassified Staphylococcus]|uniref:sensor histidine kinase n=1 Tax=unclassified Staphylococcus TaxID=91994 RepID=UPI0021D3977E|nr:MULTISPECIES: HAMP domain-containing sensor histidine kinase [unclassified Staphylococcus]UXR69914.1 HAMP domain-containing histidine kinase [Staphylococcus sp. IVB6246]UXR71953.1 HAMP domain-containing histidine kinase [Staphylococcus sp. IVB6240]UXR76650.1 HAMP domain-containing histidine kinase [Staphylococcus sp. IVB6233]UXR80779.1 HAMP domain-containing histidine kinase [Staphylococcus sp. IVB6218]
MKHFKWTAIWLRERYAWIMLLILLDMILIGVGYLDQRMSIDSAWFVLGLQVIVGSFYLIFMYIKEIKFYEKISEGVDIREIHHRDYAESPFEKYILDYLENKLVTQKQTLEEQRHWLNMNEQAVTEFVHDIKTPVTAMKLLIEQEPDFTRRQQLMYEWSRIAYMLDQQLFLSRLNHQAHDMFFEVTQLRQLVVEEVRETRHISMRKGLGFEIDVPSEIEVYTDKRWCKMVIRQIISNAVKYTNTGDIVIRGVIEDAHVSLSIADKGCGIPPHDLPRIFSRGFTGDIPETENASGMGLYLVDSVKEALGLTIDVQSEVGHGTSVTLFFSKQNQHTQRMSK